MLDKYGQKLEIGDYVISHPKLSPPNTKILGRIIKFDAYCVHLSPALFSETENKYISVLKFFPMNLSKVSNEDAIFLMLTGNID